MLSSGWTTSWRLEVGVSPSRLVAILVGAILLTLSGAPDAWAAKVVKASFTFTPDPPTTNEVITFRSTSAATSTNVDIVSEQWDLDGNGAFDNATGATAARSFAQPGVHSVGLRVTDRRGFSDVVTRNVTVRNHPPIASFSFSPAAPATGQPVTFLSHSRDPDGQIARQLWDLDGDGNFDDATGPTAARSFDTPGPHTVRLRVVDDAGERDQAALSVPVGDRPPAASFTHLPSAPGAGEPVSFFSTSTDPDGPISGQAWDLDNDGTFDDATGPAAVRSFASPGTYTVSLRVTDGDGVSTVATQAIAIGSISSTFARGLRLISPFPVVRLSGTITRKGTRLRRLAVSLPGGALLTVRCHGRGCPFARQTRKASLTRRAGPISARAYAARLLRVRRLERRLLRVGATLRLYITKPGEVGKYTRFKIRRSKPPTRLDRCLMPLATTPARCPES
jgi:PKD repeat protein